MRGWDGYQADRRGRVVQYIDVRADLQPVEKTHAHCPHPLNVGGEGGGDRGQLSQHIAVLADRMPPVLLRWQCLTDSSGFNFINAFLFF